MNRDKLFPNHSGITGILYLALSIFGFLGAFFSIFRSIGHRVIWLILALFLFCLAIYFEEKWRRSKSFQIPHQPSHEIRFGLATEEELEDIYRIDKRVFDERDLIDVSVFKEWHRKNDETFFVFRESGRVIGYFSILPMTDKALNNFINGHLRQTDIRARDILTKQKMRSSMRLYFFSLALERKHCKLTELFFRQIAVHLNKLKDEGNVAKLYAMPATDDGEKLCNDRFHFRKIKESYELPDNHPLYLKDIAKVNDLENLILRHPS